MIAVVTTRLEHAEAHLVVGRSHEDGRLRIAHERIGEVHQACDLGVRRRADAEPEPDRIRSVVDALHAGVLGLLLLGDHRHGRAVGEAHVDVVLEDRNEVPEAPAGMRDGGRGPRLLAVLVHVLRPARSLGLDDQGPHQSLVAVLDGIGARQVDRPKLDRYGGPIARGAIVIDLARVPLELRRAAVGTGRRDRVEADVHAVAIHPHVESDELRVESHLARRRELVRVEVRHDHGQEVEAGQVRRGGRVGGVGTVQRRRQAIGERNKDALARSGPQHERLDPAVALELARLLVEVLVHDIHQCRGVMQPARLVVDERAARQDVRRPHSVDRELPGGSGGRTGSPELALLRVRLDLAVGVVGQGLEARPLAVIATHDAPRAVPARFHGRARLIEVVLEPEFVLDRAQ